MADGVRVDDLTDLWRAGAVQLPQVAAQYSELARRLHMTGVSSTERQAFGRSTGGLGPLWYEWTNRQSPLATATILPNEPNDVVADLTDGELPSPDEFRPRH